MGARSHHNRYTQRYYINSETQRHFEYDSFNSDHDKMYSHQAAKRAAIRFCANNPREDTTKLECYTVRRIDGHYKIELITEK